MNTQEHSVNHGANGDKGFGKLDGSGGAVSNLPLLCEGVQ